MIKYNYLNIHSMWTRSGSAIDNDSDRNVVELIEVGAMQYQTSVLFNSLDKVRDEGLYTCKVEALFLQRNNTVKKKIQLSHNIELQSELIVFKTLKVLMGKLKTLPFNSRGHQVEYFILLVHNFYLALNLYLQNVCKWRVRQSERDTQVCSIENRYIYSTYVTFAP